MADKPTWEQILEVYDKSLKTYKASKLQEAFIEDNRFYELDFLADLNIPTEFKKDATVLPTARDRLDALVDHTDISNARITVNKRRHSGAELNRLEMLEKFGQGLIHRTNVESDISPLRVSAKHFWLHGISWIKTVFDRDVWDKDGGTSLPIILQAINPSNIIPDPYHNGRDYIFEVRKKLVYDAKRMPWYKKNSMVGARLENMEGDVEVEQIEYWDDKYRCILIEREPVWTVGRGVVAHKYGFLPYTAIESGLGNVDVDNSLVKRYVGILRYMKGLLVSQSSIYSMADILTKLETMIGGYITGADAGTVGKISQAYGKWTAYPNKDIKFNRWERNLAPREAYAHLAFITDLIDIHSAPKSMFGLGETGVRSGADRRLVLAEAQSKLNYSKDAFGNGWAQILAKCAKLVKDVIPGDFSIWAKSSSMDFDVSVNKKDFREPFNFYVEFSPISEEDEYRRHQDLMEMFNSGLYTKQHARSKLSDVDVKALEKQELKEMLRSSEAYLGTLLQHFIPLVNQALAEAGLPAVDPLAGQPLPSGEKTTGQGRPLVPDIPKPPGQGQGGGGNSQFGVVNRG
ncbi:hypothetical protein LCGC14_0349850 [marine sediment metagenome]|uniref:Uncharacterized protein n=1 Tax=marine sediment metagenome TaxID=412755 RepID=A0A0F9WJ42_9ZZZZ